jgi:hypothetical protein
MMRLFRRLPLLLLFAPVLGCADDSPGVGTWTAKMHDLPAIRMVVKDAGGGKLSGSIIFYFLKMEDGVWHVRGDDSTDMIDPHLEGNTLMFKVPHAKKHGSTDPKDQEIKTFKLEIVSRDEAVFRNADNGQDLKLKREK